MFTVIEILLYRILFSFIIYLPLNAVLNECQFLFCKLARLFSQNDAFAFNFCPNSSYWSWNNRLSVTVSNVSRLHLHQIFHEKMEFADPNNIYFECLGYFFGIFTICNPDLIGLLSTIACNLFDTIFSFSSKVNKCLVKSFGGKCLLSWYHGYGVCGLGYNSFTSDTQLSKSLLEGPLYNNVLSIMKNVNLSYIQLIYIKLKVLWTVEKSLRKAKTIDIYFKFANQTYRDCMKYVSK